MKPPEIAGRMIGYARVSTDGQSTAAQVEQLRAAGCSIILRENASGGDVDRPELARALSLAKAGDVLMVTKLDRLARSMLHMLETVEDLDKRRIGFRSLGDPVDTTTPQGRFTLQILAAVGELERALIRERTVAGLEHARAQGRVGGNPGLAARDPATIRKLTRAREDRRSQRLAENSHELQQLLEQFRPELTWDQLVRILNHRKIARPNGGGEWARDALIRTAKRLVEDGLADPKILQRSPRRSENEELITLVAALSRSPETRTLQAIAKALTEMHQPTPRGRLKWHVSSVKNLLDQAREKGLVGRGNAAVDRTASHDSVHEAERAPSRRTQEGQDGRGRRFPS